MIERKLGFTMGKEHKGIMLPDFHESETTVGC